MRLFLTLLRGIGLGGGEPTALANVFMQVRYLSNLVEGQCGARKKIVKAMYKNLKDKFRMVEFFLGSQKNSEWQKTVKISEGKFRKLDDFH